MSKTNKLFKETVVIRHRHPFINNFNILPLVMDADDKLPARVVRIVDDGPLPAFGRPNFDVLITDKEPDILIRTSVPCIVLPRFGKYEQHEMLRKITERVGADYDEILKGFLLIRTHKILDWSCLVNLADAKRVVFKPSDGARGLAQIVVDSKKMGLRQAIIVITRIVAIGKVKDKSNAEKAAEIEKIIAAHPAMHLNKGNEFEDHEWVSQVEDIDTVQEVIENVASEWRVIVDFDGKIQWVQRREITGDVFKTACGSDGDPLSIGDKAELEKLAPGVVDRFNKLVWKMAGRLNSFDLFVTNNGCWGIFEFSNQWGIAGVPARIAERIQMTAIEAAVKAHLDATLAAELLVERK